MSTWVVRIVIGALMVAFALAFVRLVRGPSSADRVVALDLIAILSIGFLGVFAVASGEPAFLDAAITLALVAFLATTAFARYVEESAGQRREAGRRREEES